MKKLIYFAIIICCGCTTSKFLTLQHFDTPVNYERSWDDSVTAIYEANYDNIWEDEKGGFTLFANDSIASRLVTEESFNVELPFIITFEVKAKPTDLALFGIWFYPVDDNGGFLVSEPDAMEIDGDRMVFSLHRGEDGYGGHWFVQEWIDIDVTVWNKVKMKVTPFEVTWWINGKKIYHVKKDIPEILYYLRISIIMSKNHKHPEYSIDARMDVRNIKIKHF